MVGLISAFSGVARPVPACERHVTWLTTMSTRLVVLHCSLRHEAGLTFEHHGPGDVFLRLQRGKTPAIAGFEHRIGISTEDGAQRRFRHLADRLDGVGHFHGIA